jgi:hypothetical protein
MTFRRLTAFTILLLALSMSIPVTGSFAGASCASVVAYNNLGLVNPGAIAAHGKYVWIADRSVDGKNGLIKNGQVVRLDASTGAHLSVTSPLLNDPVALISDGSYVWVVNEAKFSCLTGDGGTVPLDCRCLRRQFAANRPDHFGGLNVFESAHLSRRRSECR